MDPLDAMMIKAFPSSPNSVDTVAREAAKDVARRAGLTLGEYLDQIVAEQGTTLGTDARELEAGSPRKLRRPSAEMPGFRLHPHSRSVRERDAWRMRHSPCDRDFLQALEDRSPNPEDEPASRLSSETAGDEDAMAHSGVRPASVAEQLAEIEQRLLRGAGSSEPIRAALARLERDLNARRIADGALADRDLRPLQSDLSSLLQTLRIPSEARGSREPGGWPDDALAQQPNESSSDDRRGAPAPLGVRADACDPAALDLYPQHRLAGDEHGVSGPRGKEASLPGGQGVEERRYDGSAEDQGRELRALRQQMADLSRTIASLSPQAAMGALEASVQQLAVKIDASTDPRLRESLVAPVETIAADLRNMLRSADTRSAIEDLDQDVKAIAGKIETLVSEIEPSANAELRDLRDGLTSLAARPMPFDKIEQNLVALAERLERLAVEGASRAAVGQIMTALDAVNRQINASSPAPVLKNIEQQIAGLAIRIDQVAATVPSHKAIEDLSKRLDAAHQSLAARIEASRPMPTDVKGVETQMALLAGKLDASAAAEARSITALDGQISKIAQRIERVASEGASRAHAAELATSLEQLRRAVAMTAPADAVQALSKRIDMLAGKVSEVLLASPAVAKTYEDWTRRLDSQLAKMAERIDRLPVESAARGGAELATSLDEIRRAIAATAPAEAMQTLSKRIDILASKVTEALLTSPTATKGYEELTKRLDAQLVKIAERIERAGEGAARMGAAELAASLEGLRRSIAQAGSMEALTKRMDGLADKVDEILRTSPNAAHGYEELTKRIAAVHHSLAARLDMPQPAAKIETNGLEAMVRALAAKMDSVRPIEIEPRALDSIEAQVSRIAEKIDRSDEGLISLGSLQRSILDLFGQLEETRHAALDAAETAARTAARDTLREAMLNAPAGADKASGDKEAAEQISRQLTEIRALQDDSDRRVHTTLSAVHSTLEIIAGRLAALNDEADLPALSSDAAAPRDKRRHFSLPEPTSSGLDSALDILAKAVERHGPGEAQANAAFPPAPQDAPRKDDFLIEPGSRYGSGESPRASSGQASFIAAARRAAQAAAAESASQKRANAPTPEMDERAAKAKQARLVGHNLKLLIGLGFIAAISVLFIAYQLAYGSLFSADSLPPGGAKSEAPSIESGKSASASTPPGDPAGDSGPSTAPKPAATKSIPSDQAAGATLAPVPPMATSTAQPLDGGVSSMLPPQPAPAAAAALNEAAQAGNPAAQYELGTRLADGRDVNRDFKMAAAWFEKAATQGLAPAQFRLGTLYEKGLGVQRDETIAKLWYQRAGERGNAHAMHNLAVLTAEGGANKPDYATAAGWFRKAAELGIRDSQYNLAILYARGLGIEQNLAQSYLWFSVAAAQGDEDAGKKRDEVAARLDAKSLEAAKTLVGQFQAKEPDRSANEVTVPAAGWGAVGTKAEPKPSARMPAKPKVSRL